jgi:hypothetical protein
MVAMGNNLGIHRDPCASTGIYFRLSWPKVTVPVVRGRRGFDARPTLLRSQRTNDRMLFVEGLMGTRGMGFQPTGSPSTNIVRTFVSRERNRSNRYRRPNELPTIAASSLPPTRAKTDASGCAWIAVDANIVFAPDGFGPSLASKNFWARRARAGFPASCRPRSSASVP